MSRGVRYRVLRKIAHGGMAEIFLALQIGAEGFEKPVVLKRILPAFGSDPAFVRMLVDEAHIVSSLSHTNLVQILDLGKADDQFFLVLEFVDGWSLEQVRRRARKARLKMPLPLALYVTSALCRGLDYVHRRARHGKPLGIVHRDVTPQNVLLGREGDVKLADFGIAKAIGRREKSATGVIKGKFAYMSPEQTVGAELDARSDLFSVGTLLYLLTTGKKPFEGPTDLDVLMQVRKARHEKPSTFVRDFNPDVERFIERALRPDRARRWQSAEQMADRLDNILIELGKPAGPAALKRWLDSLSARDGIQPPGDYVEQPPEPLTGTLQLASGDLELQNLDPPKNIDDEDFLAMWGATNNQRSQLGAVNVRMPTSARAHEPGHSEPSRADAQIAREQPAALKDPRSNADDPTTFKDVRGRPLPSLPKLDGARLGAALRKSEPHSAQAPVERFRASGDEAADASADEDLRVLRAPWPRTAQAELASIERTNLVHDDELIEEARSSRAAKGSLAVHETTASTLLAADAERDDIIDALMRDSREIEPELIAASSADVREQDADDEEREASVHNVASEPSDADDGRNSDEADANDEGDELDDARLRELDLESEETFGGEDDLEDEQLERSGEVSVDVTVDMESTGSRRERLAQANERALDTPLSIEPPRPKRALRWLRRIAVATVLLPVLLTAGVYAARPYIPEGVLPERIVHLLDGWLTLLPRQLDRGARIDPLPHSGERPSDARQASAVDELAKGVPELAAELYYLSPGADALRARPLEIPTIGNSSLGQLRHELCARREQEQATQTAHAVRQCLVEPAANRVGLEAGEPLASVDGLAEAALGYTPVPMHAAASAGSADDAGHDARDGRARQQRGAPVVLAQRNATRAQRAPVAKRSRLAGRVEQNPLDRQAKSAPVQQARQRRDVQSEQQERPLRRAELAKARRDDVQTNAGVIKKR